MFSVKKLEDTVQCKWSIDYKGFLKCALKRNENAEGAQRLRGCSREAPLDFRTFSTHIVKKLCKNYYVDSIYLRGWIGNTGKTN